MEVILLWNVGDGWFYLTTSRLILLGLKSFRDCLAYLDVLEGSSKRGPNKQGLEKLFRALVQDNVMVCRS